MKQKSPVPKKPGRPKTFRWKDHPNISDFMRVFDAQRNAGKINYRALWRSIQAIDPTISYASVFFHFRKLGDPFIAQQAVAQEVHRHELRSKKKLLANQALDEALENPSRVPLKDRLRLGESATREELLEIGMILSEQHKQKQDSLIDSLLDQARYGDRTIPLLDKNTHDFELPEPAGPEEPESPGIPPEHSGG